MSERAEPAATTPLQDRQGTTYVRLLNLLAATQIAFLLTTSLWCPPFSFPQVPLFGVCRGWPPWVDFVAFLGSLAGTFFAKRPTDRFSRRIRHAICAVSFAMLFVLNQHRLQPWAYQLFILHAWLALAYPRWMLTGWRWLTISIYFYSALSKVDYAFCTSLGPFLLDGFLQAFGFAAGTAAWPERVRFVLSALMPAGELLTAVCLCFQRTQRFGLVLSILMHLFLIVALGPWGHGHSAGVLIWNGFFIVQNWLLFPSPIPLNHPFAAYRLWNWTQINLEPAELPVVARTPFRDWCARLGWLVLFVVLLMPLYESAGLWDHWPSWAVYSARPARTTVYIHEDDLDRLPAELNEFLLPPAPLDPWHPLRIDRWSLAATKTPIYPQRRFQIGVALAVAERYQLPTLRITVESRPDRQTGKRSRRELIGLAAIREHAATYWLNALPK